MILKKLIPGMVVYDVRIATGLNKFNGRYSTYTVSIIEVDENGERVFARWNGNSPEWYQKHTWSKWRTNKPLGRM